MAMYNPPHPGEFIKDVYLEPPEVFLALSFDENTPQGTVTFHKRFKADGPQGHAGEVLQ